VKVTIDPTRCVGHGLCYMNAPSVYVDDDQGYGHPVGDGTLAPEQHADAELGAANCPERAITLTP